MNSSREENLFLIADRQLGYFTTQQAESCGYPRSNFHRFIKSGKWIKEIRGIFRLSHYPVQNRSELVLWSLWSRNKQGKVQGVWSHETALDIHEITDVMPTKMHMTVPKTFRRNKEIPQILYLHFNDLQDKDIEIRQGYKLTTPGRTLIDVYKEGSIDLDQVKQGLNQALRRGILSKKELQEYQREFPSITVKLLEILNDYSI